MDTAHCNCQPQLPTFRCAEEVVDLDLRGEKVRFDVNGMKLLGPRDDAARQRPSFRWPNPTVSKMTLEVTHRCNLACRYCFVREQYPDEAAMGLGTAQKAFKRLLPKDRDIGVTFFGGEPLLAWDLISEFIPWARGCASERAVRMPDGNLRPQECHFHITTNGTLLTPPRVAWLAAQRVSFITSLDGPADVHDAQRPFAGLIRKEDWSGEPPSSHAATLHGLALLGKAGLGRHNTIRATYDVQAVRDSDDAWLLYRLQYLTQLCRQGVADNCSIEPAFASCAEINCLRPSSRPKNRKAKTDNPSFVESLAPGYWLAADWYLKELREGRSVRFFHFDKFLERVRQRIPQPAECGAGYGVLSVSPDGTICACHRETGTAVGHLDDGIDEMRRAAWLDNRLYARQGCMTCWARYLCGGGCRMDSFLHLGDVHQPCPWECELKKLLITVALWLDRELAKREMR
jgi:uncharacterized protein